MNELDQCNPKPCFLNAANITDTSIEHMLFSLPFNWSNTCMLLFNPSGIWLTLYVVSEFPNMLSLLCVTFKDWLYHTDVCRNLKSEAIQSYTWCNIYYPIIAYLISIYSREKGCFRNIWQLKANIMFTPCAIEFIWGRIYCSGDIFPCLIDARIAYLQSHL